MDIFELAFAKKLGGGSGTGGVTIKNQDKTFTENGSYSADSGYTGLGIVKVDVQPKNQDITVTENGTYTAENGYTGLGTVTVDVLADSKIDELISRTVTEMTEKDFEGATSIGAYAFHSCASLVSVVIPTTIKSIGDYAFEGCANLVIYYKGTRTEWEAISISSNNVLPLYYYYSENEPTASGFWHYVDGIPTIWPIEDTSQYSEGLAYTLKGDSYTVSGIGECTDVDVIIPNSVEGIPVTSIGDTAFNGCKTLTSVTIPYGVTSIGYAAFSSCTKLTSISIPESVTTIGDYAFQTCNSVANITIPDRVTSIGTWAFANWKAEFFDFTACTDIPTLASGAFANIYTEYQIRVPASLYDEWIAATNWSNYASNIVAV